MARMRRLGFWLALTVLVAGCASAGSNAPGASVSPVATSSAHVPARITAAILANPPLLFRPFLTPASLGQTTDLSDLMLVGLTNADNHDQRQPVFAEAVPTLDNGLWTVNDDGAMTVTWHIRPGSQWHDGEPMTSADMVFTFLLDRDPAFPELRATAAGLVDHVDAPDPSTVTVTWKSSYIYANRMFTTGADGFATPLPSHLLEQPYRDSKDTFRQLSYWSADYVGNGPFKVKEFVPDNHVTVSANDHYILGRPKIDEIEVRFIPDANTLTANLLSNTVELTLGASLATDQSVDVRDSWHDGHMELTYNSWLVVFPQFINPDPAIVADVRFRQAMLLAIDRQAMVDTIQHGLVPVADSYLTPTDPEYAETQDRIVRYPHDPRQAMQLLEELGYTRGADGALRDGQNQPLSMEVRATASPEIHTKTLYPMVDYWQRLGIQVEPVVIPVQRFSDLEYRTNQPTFEVVRYPNGATNLWRVHGAQTPLPENGYTGFNRSRYMNPAFDALLDRYNSTIPWEPRMQILGQIINHMTTVLNVMGLFYDTKTVLVSNRIQNIGAENTGWNAYAWEVS